MTQQSLLLTFSTTKPPKEQNERNQAEYSNNSKGRVELNRDFLRVHACWLTGVEKGNHSPENNFTNIVYLRLFKHELFNTELDSGLQFMLLSSMNKHCYPTSSHKTSVSL
jgi:hypothetical protein